MVKAALKFLSSSIDPRLPEKWTSLRYRFLLNGEIITCHITRDRVHLEAGTETDQALPVTVQGNPVPLRSGGSLEVEIVPA